MAILKIYNEIRTENENNIAVLIGETEGVTYKNIDAFCSSLDKNDKKIDIRIHCNGGSVTEGWAIYDRLRATDKELTATIEGTCASMATIILLAAPKERRRAYENAHILIHNPYMPVMENADADELQKISDELRQEQEKMVNLYVERCGCDRDEIQSLMNEDKFIDTQEALRLGLIGEVVPPMSAMKTFSNNNNKSMRDLIKKFRTAFNNACNEMEQETKALELSTADGGMLIVEREEGAPEVGDKAAPDGEFLMPDGVTIIVNEGVITEVRPAEAPSVDADESVDEKKGETDEPTETSNEDEEEQHLRERIAELEKENEELRQRLEESKKQSKSQDDMRILNLVKMAGGEEVLKQMSSNYKPSVRTQDGKRAAKKSFNISASDIINKQEKAYLKSKEK